LLDDGPPGARSEHGARFTARARDRLDRVREIQAGVSNEHVLVLENGTRLKLSDRYRHQLEQRSRPRDR
jgi:hypothetical protein